MRKRIITLGATFALVMSLGGAALAAPAQPGSGNPGTDPQFHAGHWGYVKSFENSGKRANGVPANEFHDGTPYTIGIGGWADYVRSVKQGGPNR